MPQNQRSSKTGLPPGFARALLGWFDLNRRDLPWRYSRDPYAIWISEVMLQQTQVTTVIPYYTRWLERFPDVESLAAASLDDVLGLWQGLGYYGRARTLHKAARTVVEVYGGTLPDRQEKLRGIPGFGPYTSGAVASIAFGEAVPAVDGNVARAVSRLLKLSGHSSDPALREKVTGILKTAVPRDRAGDFNQAMMELGATLCRPKNPRCGDCPVARFCLSKGKAVPARRPERKTPQAVLRWNAYVVRSAKGEVYLRRRPANSGLFAGLWELPTDETGALKIPGAVFLGEIEHRLTHRTIRMKLFGLKRLPSFTGRKEVRCFASLPAVSSLTRKAMALAENG